VLALSGGGANGAFGAGLLIRPESLQPECFHAARAITGNLSLRRSPQRLFIAKILYSTNQSGKEPRRLSQFQALIRTATETDSRHLKFEGIFPPLKLAAEEILPIHISR
jgi:hypothetical protein